jgi:glutathione synthase/RimK-type ligase-like ATP-grasp enzyme
VPHVPDTLPDEYIQKLRGMLDIFGLNFGAFDIIRDDDDRLYFIELNPNGQWYWIEIFTGMPMVKAMVELITDLANQN